MDIDEALGFVAANHRAVLVTRRTGGGLQLSPVLATIDSANRVVISTRQTAMKTKNIRRDPHVSLCVMNDRFFGPWIQVDGTAEVVSLPEAMDGLVDYYRRASGEHDDWDDYRRAMEREGRVLVLVTVTAAGPNRSG